MKYTDLVNERLEKLLENSYPDVRNSCAEAVRYSISAGGKRLRPELLIEFCRAYGGDINNALDPACALEMIHTFSLIHDDLPCMDNDDMRRGKPSCHIAYGESTALLAGVTLENEAYRIIADHVADPAIGIKLISCLSEYVSLDGMIGGQVIDTVSDDLLDEEKLLYMYNLKTSALFCAACEMGCICAGAPVETAHEYALSLGLAFQLIDDILDLTGDEKLLGKPVKSDIEQDKKTYPILFGIDRAREKAREMTEKALKATEHIPDNEYITELTKKLLNREY